MNILNPSNPNRSLLSPRNPLYKVALFALTVLGLSSIPVVNAQEEVITNGSFPNKVICFGQGVVTVDGMANGVVRGVIRNTVVRTEDTDPGIINNGAYAHTTVTLTGDFQNLSNIVFGAGPIFDNRNGGVITVPNLQAPLEQFPNSITLGSLSSDTIEMSGRILLDVNTGLPGDVITSISAVHKQGGATTIVGGLVTCDPVSAAALVNGVGLPLIVSH